MPTNHLVFALGSGGSAYFSMSLNFVNGSWQTLGSAPANQGIVGPTLVFTLSLLARQRSELYVPLRMGDGSLNYSKYGAEGLQRSIMAPTTILSVIFITAAPQHEQWTFNSFYGTTVGVFDFSDKLNHLEVSICDREGKHAGTGSPTGPPR